MGRGVRRGGAVLSQPAPVSCPAVHALLTLVGQSAATMTSLSYLVCHNSIVVKRTGIVESKYVITGSKGDVLFSFQKNGKVSGRGRQLLLLDCDNSPALMLQITELSAMYSLGVGSAQMSAHLLPGGNRLAQVVMVPGVWKGDYQIRDAAGSCVMTFERKDKLFSFCYKFKNTAGVPIGKISSMDSWSAFCVKVDFHPGLDNQSRVMIMAAAFLVTKVEFQTGGI